MGLTKAIPFRCEKCGYTLTAVATADTCQECGTAIADSRPTARPGLAWQRGPSLRSWLATLGRYAVRPLRLYREVRIHTASSRSLFITNLLVSAAFSAIPAVVEALFGKRNFTFSTTPNVTHMQVDGFSFIALAMAIVLLPLSFVMIWVIARYFAHRQRPALASAVPWCSGAIASYSLVIALALSVAAWLLRYSLLPHGTLSVSESQGAWLGFAMAVPFLLFLLILIAGGVLDAIGNRVNRLANSLDSTA
jgi:hypothetical protein